MVKSSPVGHINREIFFCERRMSLLSDIHGGINHICMVFLRVVLYEHLSAVYLQKLLDIIHIYMAYPQPATAVSDNFRGSACECPVDFFE